MVLDLCGGIDVHGGVGSGASVQLIAVAANSPVYCSLWLYVMGWVTYNVQFWSGVWGQSLEFVLNSLLMAMVQLYGCFRYTVPSLPL